MMTTLNQYLDALNNVEAQSRYAKINEEIQRGADPLRKQNEFNGTYTEKKTYTITLPSESDIPEEPPASGELDNVRALLDDGWVVKDMSFRLEKPNLTE